MKKKNNQNASIGRTYYTNDKYLPHTNNNAFKNVNIASIEKDKKGNIIAVRLTTQNTKNSSPLKHHTYKGFKHFIEIEDVDGNPIRRNQRFKENSKDYDLTQRQVDYISDIVYNHSKQSKTNRQKRQRFRNGEFKDKKSRF